MYTILHNSTSLQQFTTIGKHSSQLHNILHNFAKLDTIVQRFPHCTEFHKDSTILITLYTISQISASLYTTFAHIYNNYTQLVKTCTQPYTLARKKNTQLYTTCLSTLCSFAQQYKAIYQNSTQLYTAFQTLLTQIVYEHMQTNCTQLYTIIPHFTKLYKVVQHMQTKLVKSIRNSNSNYTQVYTNLQSCTQVLQQLYQLCNNYTELYTLIHNFTQFYTILSTMQNNLQHCTQLNNT